MKAVFDTNILVSAIVFGGPPRAALELAIEGHVQLLISEPIIIELKAVLQRPKFNFSFSATQQIIAELLNLAEMIYPTQSFDIITRDPDDNRILECAAAGGSRYIVSGDDDLLTLREFKGISIVAPAAFLKVMKTH